MTEAIGGLAAVCLSLIVVMRVISSWRAYRASLGWRRGRSVGRVSPFGIAQGPQCGGTSRGRSGSIHSRQ